jgi:hypothetical protein
MHLLSNEVLPVHHIQVTSCQLSWNPWSLLTAGHVTAAAGEMLKWEHLGSRFPLFYFEI